MPLTLDDFDYQLPDELIARYPLAVRSASRLLYLPAHGQPKDQQFVDLPELLNSGDLVVFNDTKVMKARLFGQKASGGAVEVLVERILPDDATSSQKHTALCHVRASRSPKEGQTLSLADGNIDATVMGREDNLFLLAFDQPILPVLEHYGELPIPPYFERHADDNDETRYQTVFHDPTKLASVAAPTASLHFDDNVLAAFKSKSINTAFVTLHVGAGTFLPVSTQDLSAHIMHEEWYEIPESTAQLINQARSEKRRVVCVGTTSLRALESAYVQQNPDKNDDWQMRAATNETRLFIRPPYRFGVVDALITNFHLPQSTLLMLVSAFSGVHTMRDAYNHAIDNGYRFFSYGDAMWLNRIHQANE